MDKLYYNVLSYVIAKYFEDNETISFYNTSQVGRTLTRTLDTRITLHPNNTYLARLITKIDLLVANYKYYCKKRYKFKNITDAFIDTYDDANNSYTNYIDTLPRVKYLTFGTCFNQQVTIPNSVTKLFFTAYKKQIQVSKNCNVSGISNDLIQYV